MKPLPFGRLPNGETVEAFDLVLPEGGGAHVITLGRIITSQRVPDQTGRLADVVLGFDTLADYRHQPHPTRPLSAAHRAGRKLSSLPCTPP